MFFTLEIKSEAAAFEDDESSRAEVSRLLTYITQALANGGTEGFLVDYNGNRAGSWNYEGRTEASIEAEQKYSDEESKAAMSSAVSMLGRNSCVTLLLSVGRDCHDDESVEDLREAIEGCVLSGTLWQRDVLDALAGGE